MRSSFKHSGEIAFVFMRLKIVYFAQLRTPSSWLHGAARLKTRTKNNKQTKPVSQNSVYNLFLASDITFVILHLYKCYKSSDQGRVFQDLHSNIMITIYHILSDLLQTEWHPRSMECDSKVTLKRKAMCICATVTAFRTWKAVLTRW